jgi:hypothetical protein
MALFNPSGGMLGYYLNLGFTGFLPDSLQLSVH